MNPHLYLYGVVQPSHRRVLGRIGVDGGLVQVFSIDALGVAYSPIQRERVVPTRPVLLAHERVLEQLMTGCEAVLPFSFGTVAQDRAAVRRLLSGGQDAMQENLARVQGCIEIGVKVMWLGDAMRQEVEAATGSLTLTAAQARTTAERHSSAIQVGQVVERIVHLWQERYIPQVTSALSAECEDWRENSPIGPSMLWNGSFLVRREHEGRFLRALSDLDARLGSRLEFRHVAPLPPYNFVQVRFAAGEVRSGEGN